MPPAPTLQARQSGDQSRKHQDSPFAKRRDRPCRFGDDYDGRERNRTDRDEVAKRHRCRSDIHCRDKRIGRRVEDRYSRTRIFGYVQAGSVRAYRETFGIYATRKNSHRLACCNGTSGSVLIRRQFGLRGAALTANAIGPNATRNTAPLIEAYLQSLESQPGQ